MEMLEDSGTAACVVLSADGAVTCWDDAAAVMFGWAPEEALGRRMIDLVVPGDERAAVRDNQALHLRFARGSGAEVHPRRFECDAVDVGGRRFRVAMSVSSDTVDGHVLLQLVVHDLARRARSSAERRLAALVESSPDPILITDEARFITEWNPAAEGLFGWRRTAIVGLPVDVLFPPERADEALAMWREAQCGPGLVRFATQRLRRDGGAVEVEVTITRLDDPDAPRACAAIFRPLQATLTDSEALIERTRARSALPAELRASASSSPPPRDLVAELVEAARAHLGMEVAFLSELTDSLQIFQTVVGDGDAYGLHDGLAVPRADTLCHRLLTGQIGERVLDVLAEPSLAELPGVARHRVGAYVGVPVRMPDGRIHGTLCAFDGHQRDPDETPSTAMLHLLADLLARQLQERDATSTGTRASTENTALRALLTALGARDHETGAHSEAVVELTREVAWRLGLGTLATRQVEQVALLHDIGKIGIPDAILLKAGPLSESEWALMREHSAIGARIVGGIDALAHLADAVRAEHERWDGGGYPDGLVGERIPIAARITLACDAFHAMVTDRPYRAALAHDTALAELRAHAGTQFDPAVVGALLAVL